MTSMDKISPIITKTLWCLVLSALVGYLIPAFVAMRNDVFTEREVIKKIKENNNCNSKNDGTESRNNICTWIELYEHKKKQGNEKIDLYNSDLTESDTRIDIETTLHYEKFKEKYVILPIYKSSVYFVWPAMYATLGWLLCIYPIVQRILWGEGSFKGAVDITNWKLFIPWIGLVYVLYRTTYLFRNFMCPDAEDMNRVIYAYTNYDICRPCFYVQEANAVILVVLLCFLWHECLTKYNSIRIAIDIPEKNNDGYAPINSLIKKSEDIRRLVSTQFAQWQITSVVLALGFVFVSSYYWILVWHYGDARYSIDGLVVHILWGISWGVVSLPLMKAWITWKEWLSELRKAIFTNNYGQAGNDDSLNELISASPVGVWNLVASSIAAVVSFFIPVLQFVIK